MGVEMAAKELYSKLSQFKEIVGFGIGELNGAKHIVIYLVERNSFILSKIPKKYFDFLVKTEVTGEILYQ